MNIKEGINLNSMIMPFDTFEISWNIMENGGFAFLEQMLIFHNIFKSIQNLA